MAPRPKTLRGNVVVRPILLGIAILAAWQVAVALADLPPVIAPSPADVLSSFGSDWRAIAAGAGTTALTAGGGLAIGVLLGGFMAFSMVQSREAARLLVPYLLAARIAPLIALAPLVFFWFGDAVLARMLLVGTMTPFPVALASYEGLRSVPQRYLDLARSVAAPPKRTFLRVRVPAAAGSIRAGIRLAGALAVIGAVVTEFLALNGGLGFRLYETQRVLDTPGMVATMLAVSALGIAFYTIPAAPLGRFS